MIITIGDSRFSRVVESPRDRLKRKTGIGIDMSNERYQNYRDLVYELLKCSGEERLEVLADRPELIDAGLVETLSQIAAELIAGGDFDEAQQLQILATRINADLAKVPVPEQPVIPLQAKQEADRLLQQGIERYQTSQFKSALHAWQQALGIYQEIGDTAGEADALSNLGIALQSLGQYQKAIERYQQSVAVKRESGEWLNVALATTRSPEIHAIGHHVRGEYNLAMKLAIEHFDKHFLLAHSIGDRLGEAKSLSHLGKAYAALGRYREAIDYHQQALELAQTIGERSVTFQSLLNAGVACEALGDYPQAVDYYHRYLSFQDTASQSKQVACALGGLGNTYYCLGEYDRALEYYQRCLSLTHIQNDLAELSTAWNGLGNTYYYLQNYPESSRAYENALNCKQEYGDRFGEAIVLGNLSKVQHSLGNYEEAQAYHHQSLLLKRSLEKQLN